MTRLGVRARVTLAFTAVMAIVLAGLGLFLYSQHKDQLNDTIDQGLRSRAGEVEALIRRSPNALRGSARTLLIESEESFTQVIDDRGRVLDSTPQLNGEPVLDAAQLARAANGLSFFEDPSLTGIEGGGRMLATPLHVRGQDLVAVVGASLGDRRDALSNLSKLLLLGGLAALGLSSLAGFLAISAALRPVEAMRRRASEISSGSPGERLPVPAGRDQLSRLGVTLNEMLARLHDAIERERRFVDDASHELRTPLALHKTELELAQRYGEGEGELRSSIASAIEEVDRLIGLSESLLLVARSSDGSVPIERRPIMGAELLAGVASRFEARAEELGRELDVEETDIALTADRVRIEQALTGLVDNALRHGAGPVRLSALRDGDRVELHVCDGGPGFDVEFLPRAFERFSRPEQARTGPGAGLGLAIVDAIAQAHGGRAAAENLVGGGADAWIEIYDPPEDVHRRFITPA